MEENNFKISRVNGTIIIEKGNQSLTINQTSDDDIWFTTSNDELSFQISMYSRDYHEWQTYTVFEDLMKFIIGRYILSSDSKNESSMLPKDFIDLYNNSITYHSDSNTDNILKLDYDEKTITITISKSKDASQYENNTVRIRTSGSNYEYYYKEFLKFFRNLNELERRLNNTEKTVKSNAKENSILRKLSLFGKYKGK